MLAVLTMQCYRCLLTDPARELAFVAVGTIATFGAGQQLANAAFAVAILGRRTRMQMTRHLTAGGSRGSRGRFLAARHGRSGALRAARLGTGDENQRCTNG
jgi:hypothetical protein